jgi:hypothetical protein
MGKIIFSVEKEFGVECSLAFGRFVGNRDGVESIEVEEEKVAIGYELTLSDKGGSKRMKQANIALLVASAVCLAVIAVVSLHSVWEIHYLKSFYPNHFSVSEAAYASVVELIKVALIAFPLVLLICVCLFLMWLSYKPYK